jgi:hypothetical protein
MVNIKILKSTSHNDDLVAPSHCEDKFFMLASGMLSHSSSSARNSLMC